MPAGDFKTDEARGRELLTRSRWTEEEYKFLCELLRFTEQEKEEANARVDIEMLIGARGICFPAGKRTPQVRCFLPGHQDDTPSLTLYRKSNHCYCFGCRTGLSPVDVLVRLYGKSFWEAMDYLLGDFLHSPRQLLRREIRARFGGKSKAPEFYGRAPEKSLTGVDRALPSPAGWTRHDLPAEVLKSHQPEVQRLLQAAVTEYKAELADCPPALDYLKSRGLTEETIRRYRLGYSSGVWLSGWLRQLGQDLGLAHKTGLLVEGGQERLAGRIILPYLGQEGQILHLTGRFLFTPAWARELLGLPFNQEDRAGVINSPKYLGLTLPKPSLEEFLSEQRDYLLLVEGPFDWLVARQWGYEAICAFGTHPGAANLETLKAALQSGKLKKLFLCLDNDPDRFLLDGKVVAGAGPQATREILDYLASDRVIAISLPPGYKDIGSLGEIEGGSELFERVFLQSQTETTINII